MNQQIANGIRATAASLGMDPYDLATIISYETAGTFDPTKAGPTTQWGQHRGLIQFGEPQARQYGVNWDDAVGSQLGENGAVAQYFRGNGYEPGMGLLDAYSIVNAGAPGRYNASDANNGGAPGSVADKVNNQMAGHIANARRLLGEPGQAAETAPQMMPQGNALTNEPAPQGNALAMVQQRNAMPQFQINALDPAAFQSNVDYTNPLTRYKGANYA